LNTITDHVYIIILLQDQIYSTGDWTQLRSHRWIIKRLTRICLPDCQPQSISTLPATTLKCSNANASDLLILSFQSLKNDADTWESFTPPGGVTVALGTNVREVTHDRELFTPLTLVW